MDTVELLLIFLYLFFLLQIALEVLNSRCYLSSCKIYHESVHFSHLRFCKK